MYQKLTEQLKANPRTIVFTEGTDARILEAADKLTNQDILSVILIGEENAVKKAAADGGFHIEKCQIVNPEEYAEMDAMVEEMVNLRKGKMTEEQVRSALKQGNYFGTMLVKMGKADCLLGGATYSTADTVRPALQLIKTKPGNKIVSSTFIMVKGEEKLAFADCAINIDPGEDDLVEIAIESAKTAKVFGIDPKVAMLSYSTLGSGKGDSVTKMANATAKVKELAPDLAIDGELQFDAAVSPTVAKIKCQGSPVAGCAPHPPADTLHRFSLLSGTPGTAYRTVPAGAGTKHHTVPAPAAVAPGDSHPSQAVEHRKLHGRRL